MPAAKLTINVNFQGNAYILQRQATFQNGKNYDLVNISAFKENIDSRKGLDCNFILSLFHIDLKLTEVLSQDNSRQR